MSAIHFYRYFATVPVLLPALLLALAWALPEPLSEAFRQCVWPVSLSILGAPIYIPFAAAIYWLLRDRPEKSHRRWSYWVPIAFALWFFPWWFLVLRLQSHSPARVPVNEALLSAGIAAGYGYGYVMLMHVSLTLGRRAGLITPHAAA